MATGSDVWMLAADAACRELTRWTTPKTSATSMILAARSGDPKAAVGHRDLVQNDIVQNIIIDQELWFGDLETVAGRARISAHTHACIATRS